VLSVLQTVALAGGVCAALWARDVYDRFRRPK
jgi:hypothetical protein